MNKNDYIGKRFVLDYKEWSSELEADIGMFDGEEGIITSLDCEVDDFESSYWAITLDIDIEISAISGYHLTLI